DPEADESTNQRTGPRIDRKGVRNSHVNRKRLFEFEDSRHLKWTRRYAKETEESFRAYHLAYSGNCGVFFFLVEAPPSGEHTWRCLLDLRRTNKPAHSLPGQMERFMNR